MGDIYNDVIFYLNKFDGKRDYSVMRLDFKKINSDFSRKSSLVLIELERLDIIKKIPSRDGTTSYLIPQPVKTKLLSLPRQFENNPYGYFLEEETKEHEAESQHKWYLRTDAKQRFDDYPIVKRQKNNAVILAVITTLSTIVLGLLQIKCNH